MMSVIVRTVLAVHAKTYVAETEHARKDTRATKIVRLTVIDQGNRMVLPVTQTMSV